MDLWNRFFPTPSKNSLNDAEDGIGGCNSSKNPPFYMDKNGVRVLLFRECDRRGRKLLYDSQTVTRTRLKSSVISKQIETNLQLNDDSGVTQRIGLKSAEELSSISASVCGGLSPKSGSFPNEMSSKTSNSNLGGRASRIGHQTFVRANQGPYVEIRNEFGYEYTKEACDARSIGELVFGSVAMSFKGSSAKFHVLKEPPRLLISRTSPAPRVAYPYMSSCDASVADSAFSSSNSMSAIRLRKRDSSDSFLQSSAFLSSQPLEVGSVGLKMSPSEEDSGFSGPSSPFSTCGSYLNPLSLPCTPMGTPSSRSGSGSSLKSFGSLSNNLQRRFLRTAAASLESFGFAGGGSNEENRQWFSRTKLGLAVLVEVKQENVEFEREVKDWWLNRMHSLESLTDKLQMALESAYLNRSRFVSMTYEAVSQLKQSLFDLVNTARLPNPLWLSLCRADRSSKERFLDSLVDSFAFLLNNWDTKQTNFFVSKLFSSVLTYHLGWVSTVQPRDSAETEPTYARLDNPLPPFLNCLWCQLVELSGGFGYPVRRCQTVLVGGDETLVGHLMNVLSYLIRSSQVYECKLRPNSNEDCEKPYLGVSNSRSSLSSLTTLVYEYKFRPNSNEDCEKPYLGVSNSRSSLSSMTTLVDSDALKEAVKDSGDARKPSRLSQDKNLFDRCSKSHLRNRCGIRRGISCSDSVSHLESSDSFKLLKDEGFNNSNSPTQTCKPNLCGLTTSKTMTDFSEAFTSEGSSPSSEAIDEYCPQDLKSMKDYKSLSKVDSNYKTSPFSSTPRFDNEVHNFLTDIKDNSPTYPEIRISSEEADINNKVIFILGEADRLEGLKSKTGHNDPREAFEKENILYESTFIPKRRYSLPGSKYIGFNHQDNSNYRKLKPGKVIKNEQNKKSFLSIRTNNLNNMERKFSKKRVSSKNFKSLCALCLRRSLSDPTGDLRAMEKYNRRSQLDLDSSGYETDMELSSQEHESGDSMEFQNKFALFSSSPSSRTSSIINYCNESKRPNESTLLHRKDIHKHGLVKVVEFPSVQRDPSTERRDPRVADICFGQLRESFREDLALQALPPNSDLRAKIRSLVTRKRDRQSSLPAPESVVIVADLAHCDVELVSSQSSNSKGLEGSGRVSHYGGTSPLISPLVSHISDAILSLLKLSAPPYLVLDHLEHNLRQVYMKSHLVSEYLMEKTKVGTGGSISSSSSEHEASERRFSSSICDVGEMTSFLNVDVNDLPLLLSVASTHNPELSKMFGLSVA